MLFPTLIFHVFFVVVFFANWALRRAGDWRLIMLLVASWIFYGWFDARFVVLLLASALLNWGAARLILAQPWAARLWLWLGVGANLLILGFFKYYGFFVDGVNTALADLGWPETIRALDVILPVGVSFFTFQGISYVVDVSKGRSEPARLLELTFLMSFFPHLVAGPIVRPAHLLPQLREVPRLTRGAAATCAVLIGWGLIKKAVIANELAVHLVDPVFNDPSAHSAADLMIASYGYAVQIYCDFSAYSDMAIGLAGLLGLRFPRNFDQPYRAASLQDFWRRWHISLSSWLRDYLYIAVFGGSRQRLLGTCLALFGTMVLGGLWHGARLNFVIWGALHGGVLVAERLWKLARPDWLPLLPQWIGQLFTFHVVTLAWIFFRSTQSVDALAIVDRIATLQPGAFIASPWTVGLIVLGLACQFGPQRAIQRLGQGFARVPFWGAGVLATVLLLVVEGLRGAGVAPFIYFQF
jgi:alginate O-acetyltransferase complex protein AlgI